MTGAARLALRFALRSAISFCVIVALLLAGRFGLDEWRAWHAAARDVTQLQDGARALDAAQAGERGAVIAAMASLRTAPATLLESRIAALGERIAALNAVPDPALLRFPPPDGGALAQGMLDKSRRMAELELLAQQRDYLVLLRAAADRAGAEQALAHLHAQHVSAYASVGANQEAQQRLMARHMLRAVLPGTAEHRQREQLLRERAQLVRANNDAARAWQAQQRALALSTAPQAMGAFRVNDARLAAAMAPLRASIADGQAYAQSHWAGRLADVAPTAAAILLSLMLLPLAIKAMFYYLLAPLAGRLAPFYVDRSAAGLPEQPLGNRSAASQLITLAPGDELLIAPDCIQSAPATVASRTRWLLDWSHPFTCLAAGLFGLTRIVSAAPAQVVVSAARDPLAEIALIHLPQGAAMVFQPRALVGIVQRSAQPLRFAHHWRLGSLHAWLTLQLRYLVLHGPVTLAVKGCRGVRVDAVDGARVISQAVTLGFSTNAAYSTSRCATFLPYLSGMAPLLNDRFEGKQGFCVYEEALPAGAHKGLFGRGLEGLVDAVFKVFGI